MALSALGLIDFLKALLLLLVLFLAFGFTRPNELRRWQRLTRRFQWPERTSQFPPNLNKARRRQSEKQDNRHGKPAPCCPTAPSFPP